MLTCYDHSLTKNMNYGSFQVALFHAYRLADSGNKETLETAFPEWFVEKRQNW